ncbi:hypothetical protein GCM10022409_11350 [Hymenobacter glaciei]|uniref:Outer membrane protein beta-barrel domain-containing protein n=1 Tax=Hymenobacter glaciei TaxID=877209 RepID=A0ABP7TNN1_9BACT
MRHVRSSLLLASAGLTLAFTAQAQVQVSLGPQVGAVSSFSSYSDHGSYAGNGRPYQTRYLAGFEGGVLVAISYGRFQLQPALLFTQRGFRIDDDYVSYTFHATTDVRLRLNYLSLPILAAYSLQASGQGWQVFGGPYLGRLVGGNYSFRNTYVGYRRPQYTIEGSMPVATGAKYRTSSNDPAAYDPTGNTPQLSSYFSRAVDVGLQAGLGYRYGNSLVRASYSRGLNNLGVGTTIDYGSPSGTYTTEPPSYSSQAFELSFAYLFVPARRP